MDFKRGHFGELLSRLGEPRRFLQIVTGPRQVGKTTLVRQVLETWRGPSHYASADLVAPPSGVWIEQQWEAARSKARAAVSTGAVLALDEVQKVSRWSEVVKSLWDADTATGLPLRVVLLGSSPLLLQEGLAESLAGRFERIALSHWSLTEMRGAFGWNLDQYVYYGGYPGAASLIADRDRWARYILDSLVETTVSRDVLMMARVNKPGLLRQLFSLGCRYSGQILSFNKMLGQLQDAGNSTTLAYYLRLLEAGGLIAGLQKYAGQSVRRRASSPKLVALNTALVSATEPRDFKALRADPQAWGRLLETTVGAHLVNAAASRPVDVYYWRERGREVDFVVKTADSLAAIEVKSGRPPVSTPGMEAFATAFSPRRKWLVGAGGVPVDEFLQIPIEELAGD